MFSLDDVAWQVEGDTGTIFLGAQLAGRGCAQARGRLRLAPHHHSQVPLDSHQEQIVALGDASFWEFRRGELSGHQSAGFQESF